MANDAKFNFYLNRTGPRGQKGEKGDPGFSPSITVNTDTADEYTLLIQNEYDSLVTDNIRPTYDDRGGTYVRVDRTNNVQYFGSADIATTANYGEVKLAQASDLASTVDVGNSNVITVELLKTWLSGQLADNLVTTTNNVTIQGQKIFATPTRFMDTVRVGNKLMVAQEDTGTITFDTDETGTVIGTHLTSTGDASFSKNVTVDGTATIEGGLNVAGNAVISNPQLGNTTISGDLTTNADINIQGQKVHLQHTNPTMYLKNMNGVNEIEIFRGLFTAGNPSPADNYLSLGHSQLQLNLTGKAIKANGKDVATADTVDAIQSDLNIAKQDIIEAQGDIDNLQMNKQNKLTAGSGITIDADNVISATGGVVDLPIASSTTLGGIKVGENLTISEDGTLSATGGGSSITYTAEAPLSISADNVISIDTTDLGGSGGRNVGEIITSSLPLTDAGLHLLDGSRLSGDGIYKGFVDYIADLYNNTKVYNPSAFTVVGSPTITDDGIASGFSSNSFLQVNINLSNKPFIFETPKFVYSQVATNRQYLFSYGSYGTGLFMQAFITSTGALNTSMRNNNTDIFYKPYQLTLNNSYQIKYVLNTTEASIYLKTNDNDYELWYTTTNTSLYTVNNTNMCIGQENNNSTRFYLGSIDLKQFSITVDGKEVFSGSKPAKYFTDETTWQTSVTTYGSCGKFVYDSTNNTVRLPKVSDILQSTTDITALGDLVEAGLPNITGTINGPSGIRSSGAFTVKPVTALTGGNSSSVREGNTYFNASLSNSIYGKSSTVQPQTIKYFVYIVIANSAKTDIQVDIDNIATDLNGKADVDLTNITSIAPILEMIQNTDSSKVGYVYSVPYTINTAVYAPTGGKWLILNCYYIASSTAIVYHYSNQNVYTGSIVNGGTLILQARSDYGSVVGLLKIA